MGSKEEVNAEVSAGIDRKTADDLGLRPASSYLKNELLYKGNDRDINRDTFPGVEMERKSDSSERQDTERQGKSILSALIMAYAEGRMQGFTLSQLLEETTQSGQFQDTSRDTLKRTLNRMAGENLAKIGVGERALFCKPQYEEDLQAKIQKVSAHQMPGDKTASCTADKSRLPRVAERLIKKPEAMPVPVNFSSALGLEQLIPINTGTVGVVGGSTDSGKTVLLLDFVMRNMDRLPIRYINWEMGDEELYKRLLLLSKILQDDSFYEKVQFVDWSCDALDRHSVEGMIHLIDPDKINIVDYLTANDDFFKIGAALELIHNRLRNGICLVALQKDPDAKLPYGKGHTQKVARVALTLDPAPDKGSYCNHLRFTKAKGSVNLNIKPTEVDIFFDIQEGTKMIFKEARYKGKNYKSLNDLIAGAGQKKA